MALAAMMGTTVIAAAPKNKKQDPAAPAAAAKRATVTLIADGQTREVQTAAATIAELFKEQDLRFGNDDRCSFTLSSPVKDGLRVAVTRVRNEVVVERKSIPFPTRQKLTGGLPIGKKKVLVAGKNGERSVKYRCYYKDGQLTQKLKLAESRTAPRPQIEVVGTRGMTLASRGYFAGRRVIEMVATGYGPNGNGKWGARTASGLRPGFGVVAVDPRFIPLGTRLYVDGYGYAVAGDTGGAIKGARIDLGYDSNSSAMAVGRRRVRVLILD
jgi:3D (Asp-Asp-Asp) domain-containing protein